MSGYERWPLAGPNWFRGCVLGVLTLALVACDDEDGPTSTEMPPTVAEVVGTTTSLSTLEAALGSAGLTGALEGGGSFTVFAPNDEAFEALGSPVVSALLESGNATLLEKVLTFHVVPGVTALSSDLSDGQTVTTLQGEELTIGVSGGGVTVNGRAVVQADLEGSNGVVHILDGVLVPEVDIVERAVLTEATQTLVDLVVEAGLVGTLSSDNGGDGFTVFAPTDAAFAELSSVPSGQALVDVLTYHVLSGTVEAGDLSDGLEVTTVQGATFTVKIDGSSVTITDGSGSTVSVILTDVPASNGVIHLLDGVLLPS